MINAALCGIADRFKLLQMFVPHKVAFNHLLAVCVGLVRLPVSFSSFLFFVGRKSLNHFVNNFFHFFVAHTKLYRIFVV